MNLNYLGIDLGTNTCGLALAKCEKNIFFISGLTNLKYQKNHFKLLIISLKEIIKMYDINIIILGIPLLKRENKTYIYNYIYNFFNLLQKSFSNILVEVCDESNTTKWSLNDNKMNKIINKKSDKDIMSAKYLLETYLKKKEIKNIVV